MSKVTVEPQYLPETSIEGKFNLRYKLATEDRNQSSAWSNIKTLTLPSETIQVGTSTTGLIMSAVSVTDTILFSTTVPTNDENKLTFSWTPADGVTFNRSEYDLYGYFSGQPEEFSDFNQVSPIFLGTVGTTGTYVVDPTAFSTRQQGMLLVTFDPLYVVFVMTKKTNVKSIYNFKLNAAGTGITDSNGTTITQHNVVSFVSPKFAI